MSKNKYIKWKDNELHDVLCDFCQASSISKFYFRLDGMRVTECSHCGLCYLNPRPLDHLVDKFYEKEYFTGESADKGIGLRTQTNEDQEIIVGNYTERDPRPINLLESKTGELLGKEILEIGCATGDLLTRIKDRGVKVTGLEISSYAAEIARGKLLNVHVGKIEQLCGALQNRFDIAVALEVIEHVVSPTIFLKSVNSVLKQGGHLLLSTPNYGCAEKYGENWLGFMTSFEHIWYFSTGSLKKLASKEGFELVYWETGAVSGSVQGQKSKVEELWFRFKKCLAIQREIGIKELIRLKMNRRLDFYPYGTGHTLFLLFKKADNK